jgi:glutathione S-transferase
MNLSLYYAPYSCATVPYITLTEAGAEFQTHVVNFRQGEHLRPEYLRLNPNHKVPVLSIDGTPLTENVAIQLWIARTFSKARLLPTDGLNEFKAIALIAWCASGIHPFLTPNARPQRYCDLPDSEDSVRRCAQKMLHENFQVGEGLLTQREYFFDHFTIPDAYFFWCFRRGIQFNMDLSGYPHCMAHYERVAQRPSVQKLLTFESAALQASGRAP